jgi:hypothetical protein
MGLLLLLASACTPGVCARPSHLPPQVQRVSRARFATAGGPTSKPAVVVFTTAPPSKYADAAATTAATAPPSCRVTSASSPGDYPSGGYNLDWSSARRAGQNSSTVPGDFQLFPTARRLNATAVACLMPAISVAGPAKLAISLDGNKTWSAGQPIVFFDAISAAVARRPYIAEREGHVILQSDAALDGTTLDVTVLFTPSNRTWSFANLRGGAGVVRLLPLSLEGLPLTLNNDLVVTVAVRGGTDALPWVLSANPRAVAATITLYSRLIRTVPPSSLSGAIPVQIDREHVGSLLLAPSILTLPLLHRVVRLHIFRPAIGHNDVARYTLDGSSVTQHSQLYGKPIEVQKGNILRARNYRQWRGVNDEVLTIPPSRELVLEIS